jgi:cyclohexadieny/prephenate dehydrogenase
MNESLKIALLGAGQLGGAFALALRAANPDIRITAYDPVPNAATQLLALGGVTSIADSATDAAKNCDVVVLAAPVRSFRALAEEIKIAMSPGTIITDLGSVKCSMLPVITALPHARVVPGHPIAGSEKSGSASARADLFRDKLCILTPDDATDPAALEIVETLWHLVGADVLHMPIAVHDQIYAMMSHLPHAVAFVAASYFHRIGVQVQADDKTLHQFLRISRSNPRMWSDIFLENREALLPALTTFTAILRHFVTELRSGAAGESVNEIDLAKRYLPRILAASLISSVSVMEQQSDMQLRPFGGAGMRDIAAPAADAPEAAMEEISKVAHAMAKVIEAIIPAFTELEKLIGAEDEPALLALVSHMVSDAHQLVEVRQ